MKPLENNLCRLTVLFTRIAADATHVLGFQTGQSPESLGGGTDNG